MKSKAERLRAIREAGFAPAPNRPQTGLDKLRVLAKMRDNLFTEIRATVIDLAEDHSARAMAKALGVSHPTVLEMLKVD